MSARPFVVHVAKLRRDRGARWHEVRSGIVRGLECSGSSVPSDSPVEADFVLESIEGGVSVTGSVTAAWTGSCRRCLAAASGTLRLHARELFVAHGDGAETYPMRDDELDLEPMVRDAVLLELPQAPLCRPECKGLCPTCGADRNVEDCGCADPVGDPRWAALAALRFPESDVGEGQGPGEDLEERFEDD
jgi:DUF177 domain-containing protein